MSERLSPQRQHIPQDACCGTHLEPPELFCDDDQMTLCGKCLQSQEHKHHIVYGIQEAAEKYRKLFQEILNTLRKKLEVAKSILVDEHERMIMVQRLSGLGRENMNKLKESEVRVSEQICSLERMTTELERKCGEPALALLQSARYSLERGESLLLQCLEPAHITDLSLCQIRGMSQMLKVFQQGGGEGDKVAISLTLIFALWSVEFLKLKAIPTFEVEIQNFPCKSI
ncbi:putative E3 ubiquitin-protein ligase TRIML2 [Tupaia chinensis]|uniref:Putative E3 ubiquitin-protein ligase TRIML2 n=1 Tax=Tupaia chinensis TaxID=246437 RepID=L9KR07_TUPCH|nr:putative E3 ubiquitin-protein ligase TRIML2 [Tupaia chinensis]